MSKEGMRLTAEAEADRERFERDYDGGNCSCHISPPCGSCTHPGNPLNQEDDDCWEPDEEESPVSVTRYEPEEVNHRDRYETATMYEKPDGDYVEFDDYETLRRERDAVAIYRDQGWQQAEKLEQERDQLAKRCRELESALHAKEGFYQDALHSHVSLAKQRDKLAERCRELEEDLIITEEERDSSRRNASAFENAMGEAQQEAGRLRDERDTLRADYEYAFNSGEVARAECDTLRAEVELLRKDAERYRLLRAGNDYQYDGPMVVLYEKSSDVGERPYWSLAAEALDETIDAALEASR